MLSKGSHGPIQLNNETDASSKLKTDNVEFIPLSQSQTDNDNVKGNNKV